MNIAARALVVLGVSGHVVLSVAGAFASTGDFAVRARVDERPSLLARQADLASVRVAQAAAGNGGSTGGASSAGGTSGNGDGGSTGGGPGSGPGGHGGGAPSLPWGWGATTTSASCGIAMWLPDPTYAATAVDGVEQVSRAAQQAIAFCGCATQACIADALDDYADALDKALAPKPPGQPAAKPVARAVRNLPKIVREAAKRVRAAPTVKAAVKIVESAIKLVRKTIELARAPDPDAKADAVRGGDAVADTLKTAADTLARADTL